MSAPCWVLRLGRVAFREAWENRRIDVPTAQALYLIDPAAAQELGIPPEDDLEGQNFGDPFALPKRYDTLGN